MKDNTKVTINGVDTVTAASTATAEPPVSTTITDSISGRTSYSYSYDNLNEKDCIKEDEIIKCPHCGKSHYSMGAMKSTCIGYTPVYKDGKLVSQDPNYYTVCCHCLACDNNFFITTHYGKTYTFTS